jgi:K(+)-stimulated pyrophosphate-energized sodium pump
MAIVQKSSTGAGTNVIAGLATGMISTFPTVLLFAAAIWTSYALAGFYGVALAASAMMATTAMQLAIDALDQYLIMQVVLKMSECKRSAYVLISWIP